jgi:phosphoribosylamine-glycine ligase
MRFTPFQSGFIYSSGGEIVIEEFLIGEEASFFALVDGEDAVALASAQDHKANTSIGRPCGACYL